MWSRIVSATLATMVSACMFAAAGAQGTAEGGADMVRSQGQAATIMLDFVERTGLTSEAPPQRYLWTDAFALQNLLDLYRETGDPAFRDLATDLIAQVHGVLGRHRPDDSRRGWLSGLPEEEGAEHPTAAGLRIGKPLPERGPGEPMEQALEWDRDGQYFHYLTRWMDALTSAAILLEEPGYARMAAELADGVVPRILLRSPAGDPLGIAWKMSIDLSRPQVAGMNPQDALDGYATLRRLASQGGAVGLEEEIAVLRDLSAHGEWGTDDPLGLGGLLMSATHLALLPDRTAAEERLVGDLLADAAAGLEAYLSQEPLRVPPSRRLAFRELGLAIGLSTLPTIAAQAKRSPRLARAIEPPLTSLMARRHIGEQILEFWSDPEHQEVPTWQHHRDINEVMLATALTGAYPDTAGAIGAAQRK
jgi:hypothetical protein